MKMDRYTNRYPKHDDWDDEDMWNNWDEDEDDEEEELRFTTRARGSSGRFSPSVPKAKILKDIEMAQGVIEDAEESFLMAAALMHDYGFEELGKFVRFATDVKHHRNWRLYFSPGENAANPTTSKNLLTFAQAVSIEMGELMAQLDEMTDTVMDFRS